MIFGKLFGGKKKPADRFPVRIQSKRQVAEQIWELVLVSPDGGKLPEFSAGSNIDLFLKEGLSRQYSLANDPSERHRYVLAVLLERHSRGGSKMLCEELQEGDEITIGRPKNLFSLDEGNHEQVLVGAGIGITPVLSMAYRLHAIGANFRLHYRARSHSKAAYEAELRNTPFADRIDFYFTEGDDLQVFDMHKIVREAANDAHVYVCGPNGFIDHVLEVCGESLPSEQVHREFFHADTEAHKDGDEAFELVLARSGKSYTIPADKTIVEVLADDGIVIPVSCSEGICGSCITRYTEGEVDHRDMVLTEKDHAKRKEFTPCCSRAKGDRLVIDL